MQAGTVRLIPPGTRLSPADNNRRVPAGNLVLAPWCSRRDPCGNRLDVLAGYWITILNSQNSQLLSIVFKLVPILLVNTKLIQECFKLINSVYINNMLRYNVYSCYNSSFISTLRCWYVIITNSFILLAHLLLVLHSGVFPSLNTTSFFLIQQHDPKMHHVIPLTVMKIIRKESQLFKKIIQNKTPNTPKCQKLRRLESLYRSFKSERLNRPWTTHEQLVTPFSVIIVYR